MIGCSFLIEPGDNTAIAGASAALRDWEPLWDLYRPPRHSRLFEPDGTLYGFCLQLEMTVEHNRREQSLAPGDLIVVPRELALDIEPEVDLLAFRYEGAPPDYFRERFIQVWGYDRMTPSREELATRGAAHVIPEGDLRFPLTYALERIRDQAPILQVTGLETALLFGIEGKARATVGSERDAEAFPIAPGGLLILGPGLSYTLEGTGCLGRATLRTELDHQARCMHAFANGQLFGPEYDPSASGRR